MRFPFQINRFPSTTMGKRPSYKLAIWGSFIGITLGACSVFKVQQETNNVKYWGRFRVQAAQPQHVETNLSGLFSLLIQDSPQGNQLQRLAQLDLLSPFGQTLARIHAELPTSPTGSTLSIPAVSTGRITTPEGVQYEGSDIEGASERAIGWKIPPMVYIPEWLLGRIEEPSNWENGRAKAGISGGWFIQFERWTGPYPDRISATWPASAPTISSPTTENPSKDGKDPAKIHPFVSVRMRLLVDRVERYSSTSEAITHLGAVSSELPTRSVSRCPTATTCPEQL